jgi:polyhydroxyalkanoate synthesis regulator phasin
MFDILKQAVYTGIGLASLTKDKAEQLAQEVARRAKLTEQESNEFQSDIVARAEQARQDLLEEIDQRINHAFIQIGILKAGVKKETEAVGNEVRSFIDARIDEALKRFGVARLEDIQTLGIRIDSIERNMGKN